MKTRLVTGLKGLDSFRFHLTKLKSLASIMFLTISPILSSKTANWSIYTGVIAFIRSII